MPITAKQQRELIIEESFKQHQALRDTIQRCIDRQTHTHTYMHLTIYFMSTARTKSV